MGIAFFPESKDSKSKKYLFDRQKLHTAAWKFTSFSLCACMGAYITYTESWIMSPKDYWVDWPMQEMPSTIKMYYQIEISMYVFAIFQMPFEPKQSAADNAAVLIHHAATLLLLWGSYICALHRVGTAIAFLHDLSDPFMEIAKLILYSGRTKAANVMFEIFALVFIGTRNVIFPVYIIRAVALYMRYPDGSPLPSSGIYNTLYGALCVLEALHIYWAGLILKMAKKALTKNGVKDDIRNID
jgi:hypothetical protein